MATRKPTLGLRELVDCRNFEAQFKELWGLWLCLAGRIRGWDLYLATDDEVSIFVKTGLWVLKLPN
jgi:hypothetical protein